MHLLTPRAEWAWLTWTRKAAWAASVLFGVPLALFISFEFHLDGWAAGLQGVLTGSVTFYLVLWWLRKDGPP